MLKALLDKEDNSIARHSSYFEAIFYTCGLEIVHKSLQPNWDPDLLAVCIWVLKPASPPKELTFKEIEKKKVSRPKNDNVEKMVKKLVDKVVRIDIKDGR